MTEQRVNLGGRDRIASLEARYRRVAKSLVLMCVIVLAAVLVGFILIRGVINDVQAERFHNILVSCQAQNDRHDATVRELDNRLKAAEALAPDRAAQIRQSRDFTVALINTLAPVRPDCRAYANDLVSK